MVIPPNDHPFLDGIFHDIDQPFRGTPIDGNPPYGLTMLYGITMVFSNPIGSYNGATAPYVWPSLLGIFP